MNRFKARVETSKRGYIPQILEFDGDDWGDWVLDHAFVEYGTGCWVDTSGDVELGSEAQTYLWQMFVGAIPDNHYVFNTCSDYRYCYNPHCLDTLEAMEYEVINEDE